LLLSCDDWLSILQPHLREPLFSPGALEPLRRLACLLPGDCLGILEARLGQVPGPIDLSLRIKEPPQALALAERIPLPHLRSLLARWSRADESLSAVHSLWLEFDLDPERDPLHPVACAKLRAEAAPRWVIDALLPALHGKPLSEGQRQRLLFCTEAIPEGGALLYVFSLLSRGGDAVRMEIFGLDPGHILGYLAVVAPATVPRVETIAPLFEGVERIHLSFDIGEEILPRIGIEGSFSRIPRREPRWAELFARLQAHGLCTPEQRDAALAWTGYDTFWTSPARWPVRTAGLRGVCVRSLSHVKVVCPQDGAPQAKVYLAFGPLEATGPQIR